MHSHAECMLLLGSVHALWYYHVVQVVLSMLTLVLRTARCVSCSRSCSMPVPMRTVMHHVGPPAHSHTSCLLVFPPLQVSGRASESVDQAKQSSQEAWDHTKAASQETADKVRHGRCLALCSAAAIVQFARVGQVHSVCTVAPRPWNTNMPLITISTPAPPW